MLMANKCKKSDGKQQFGMKMAFLGMRAFHYEQCHQLRLRALSFLKTIEKQCIEPLW